MNSSQNTMQSVAPAFRNLLLGTAFLAFGLIVLGVILRVSGSSSACLDWPTCSGGLTEP
ncbi:MAG: COX15/CtaA family protein, partial [Anaerolineales bacterium]|nr:COX15/CtaA family protein [Anaerolineales bacterium]